MSKSSGELLFWTIFLWRKGSCVILILSPTCYSWLCLSGWPWL